MGASAARSRPPRWRSGGRERRQHERQRERAEQHLQREQGAAERHVVDGGHARARAAGHEQAPLPGRQLAPSRSARWPAPRRPAAARPRARATRRARRSRSRGRRAPRSPAAARRAPRSHSASETSCRGGARERHGAGARDHPAHEQHEHSVSGGGALDGIQEIARVIGPGEMLHRSQQLHQERCAEAGAQTDHHHQRPEANAVGGDDSAPGDVGLGGGSRHAPDSLTSAPAGGLRCPALSNWPASQYYRARICWRARGGGLRWRQSGGGSQTWN